MLNKHEDKGADLPGRRRADTLADDTGSAERCGQGSFDASRGGQRLEYDDVPTKTSAIPPPVSVIMTALHEEQHLTDAVNSVFAQDYLGTVELVVAVGPSQDRTRDIAEDLAAHEPRMTVVDNPTGRTPAGLNLAIAATDPATRIIVRTDGHAQLPPGYIRMAVESLVRTGAANVGGMMVPDGVTPFECAVARAMSEPIGLGSVSFHVGGAEGPAPTVYLGVFRRSILEATGGFNEHFTRAQDWELNHRIRETGAAVWFDPRLQVCYRPRSSISGLAKQFYGSGTWRWQIIRAYPHTASLRYLAAPVATLALGVAALSLVVNTAVVHSTVVGVVALAVPVSYLVLVAVGCAVSRRGLDMAASAWYPVCVVTMHLSWGTGFLTAALRDAARALVSRLPANRAGRPRLRADAA